MPVCTDMLLALTFAGHPKATFEGYIKLYPAKMRRQGRRRKKGDRETGRQGDAETRRQGDAETRRRGATTGDRGLGTGDWGLGRNGNDRRRGDAEQRQGIGDGDWGQKAGVAAAAEVMRYGI